MLNLLESPWYPDCHNNLGRFCQVVQLGKKLGERQLKAVFQKGKIYDSGLGNRTGSWETSDGTAGGQGSHGSVEIHCKAPLLRFPPPQVYLSSFEGKKNLNILFCDLFFTCNIVKNK